MSYLYTILQGNALFSVKFTQLEKNLHDIRSWRSWQTSSLVVPLRRRACLFTVSSWLSWIYRDDFGAKISMKHLSPCKIYFIHREIFSWEFKIYIKSKIRLCNRCRLLCNQARARSARARRAWALRALGLLLADGTPTVGGGKTFWPVSRIFLPKQL